MTTEGDEGQADASGTWSLDDLEDPFASYAEVTPRALAMLNLRDCKEQLARSTDEPLRLALAAKSAHVAMQAALTAALAGTDSTGAHTPKARKAWLSYFRDMRNGLAEAPSDDRVMSFRDLLAQATSRPIPWTGQPLAVTDDEKKLLERLTDLRDRIEHVRPGSHLIEPAYLAQTFPVAARLTLELLKTVGHHLEPGEIEGVERNVAGIKALCTAIDEASERLADGPEEPPPP